MTGLESFITLAAMTDGGVWFAFRTSNLAGQIIVIVLFIGSVFTWSVMLTKWRELKRAMKDTHDFLLDYRKENHPAGIFLKRQRYEASPVYIMYEKGCQALGSALEARGADAQDLFMGSLGKPQYTLGAVQVSQIRNMAERTMTDQAYQLERNMSFLATSTTAAPFLGLLGTVWGVMDAFSGMALMGSAMLSAVAPGIAGALLTTVIGLLVALPSSIGYNALMGRIRRLAVDMENFCQEFMADVESHYRES